MKSFIGLIGLCLVLGAFEMEPNITVLLIEALGVLMLSVLTLPEAVE